MNNRTGLPKDPTETPEAHLVGYARVSGDGQHLDTQVDELLRHGVLLEDIWQEHASAADKERPAFAAMMRGLGRNDTLVIWKLDRIGRSMSAIKEAIDQIQANGAQLKVLAQPVDTAGPMGNLALHIIAAMADFELDLVRERTNRGLQAARERGRIGGRRQTYPDHVIKQALARVKGGEPLAAVARSIVGPKGKPISRQGLLNRIQEIESVGQAENGMLAEISVSANTRQEIASSLRLIADEIEREHSSITHWGGHHGRPGSYRIDVADGAVQDDL